MVKYSFVIPVYNRPQEIRELLKTFLDFTSQIPFEIIVVEDGSQITSKKVCEEYKDKLDIKYFLKENTGPGDSRNFGMKKASGQYFIILDSDCLLPKGYLQAVENGLNNNQSDFFGGPDAAHPSFTLLQKAINFAMTSAISTGGVRGGKSKKFQPRSFNMGISKEAFNASGGFGNIHPGEDPDLSIRLWKKGFKSQLIPEAFVYHKRRIDLREFYNQVRKFGKVRPILDQWHPEYASLKYALPTLFVFSFCISVLLTYFNVMLPMMVFFIYFGLVFILALVAEKSVIIAILAVFAVGVQQFGYGLGYLESFIKTKVLQWDPKKSFPTLFFVPNG